MNKVGRVDWRAVREARSSLQRLASEHPELKTMASETNRSGWEFTLEETMAKEQTPPLVIRLSAEMLARLEKHAARLRREQPGPEWNRSDVVRWLIGRALDDVDPPKKAKR